MSDAHLVDQVWPPPRRQDPAGHHGGEKVAAKKAAFREEGMAYPIEQIDACRSLDISGIHLYTLNKADAVAEIVHEAGIAGSAS